MQRQPLNQLVRPYVVTPMRMESREPGGAGWRRIRIWISPMLNKKVFLVRTQQCLSDCVQTKVKDVFVISPFVAACDNSPFIVPRIG